MKPKRLLIQLGTMILKIAALCLAVFIIYKVGGRMYDFGFRIFAEEAVDRKPGIDINVAIVEGKSVKEIGRLLEEKGLIKSGTLFVFQEKFSEYSGDLKPGVYTLNTSMTPYEMMEIMAAEDEEDSGNAVVSDAAVTSEETGSDSENEDGDEADDGAAEGENN